MSSGGVFGSSCKIHRCWSKWRDGKQVSYGCIGKSLDTIGYSGNCWEGGKERTVGAWFVLALPPQPIMSGGFSPIRRKVLMAIDVGTRIHLYKREG